MSSGLFQFSEYGKLFRRKGRNSYSVEHTFYDVKMNCFIHPFSLHNQFTSQSYTLVISSNKGVKMNDKTGLRIISALILVAAIAGIGFFAFRAGVAQGSPVTIQAPEGQTVP